ncbi:MAG TPA: ester cyclase [Blastocatellia bacterium]|nr:ester cyclase [Blastocatellia bacterium]HMV81950.1 ester cyclase [Blastocatellia bacterium]HMX24173.1 ester cyclase [Blastocatellia bacterium]HMY72323.1 ester cyclase [Blastocatellia bacterium]HMZ16356.1 ester cyclase [Blastocatellia bacterium]
MSNTTETNKAIERRFVEEFWNENKLDSVEEFYAADYRRHDPNTPGVASGPEGVRQVAAMLRAAFPDVRLEIEDMLAEGDLVATRWTATSTHLGEYQGIAPTGKRLSVSGISITRFADGKITDEWVSWDAAGLLNAIGAA